MFKRIIALGVVLMLGIPCYAESRDKKIVVEQITNSSGTASMPVGSTTTLYTESFSLRTTEEMAVMFQATSDTSSPVVSFHLQQSYRRPTTEGSADFAYIITDTIQSSRTDFNWGCATYSTLTQLPFGRFKIVGESGNTSDTIVQMRIGKQ